jgi:CBS domain containing-hemolysin-like protein
MTLLLLYLFMALSISFLCSLAEAALLSTTATFVKIHEKSKSIGLKRIAGYRQNVEKPLLAILSLNTIAHTVGAAGVGSQATVIFGEAYFGLVSAVLTVLILVFTEIIPKTIGTRYWKSLATITGTIISVMIFLTYPLVLLSMVLTRKKSKNKTEQTTSREEISALAEIGMTEGIFHDKENKIIQNLIKLKTLKVSDIMTPRTVVALANEKMTLDEFLKNKEYLRFSRIPVYSEHQDHITGYVFRQTVFEKLAEDHESLLLENIKKPIFVIPETKDVLGLWEQLLDKKEHIALVVDEYGGMDGIVTMEDIIESLLGFEIIDEKDTIANMQEYAKERWKHRQTKYKLMLSDTSE